ncbi:OmpA family protein [Sunxiuqinia elliptica]
MDVIPVAQNTSNDEFGCVIVRDTLFFLSHSGLKMDNNSTYKKGYGYFNVKRAQLDEKGMVQGRISYDLSKSSKYHDGPLCFDPITGYYYITRSGFDEARQERKVFRKKIVELKIDIYNPSTKKAEPFRYNSDQYSVAHPTITHGGDTLYFVSDMPGGYGGKDIYRSIFRNGRWKEPENLGSTINTMFDEVFPSIHKSGTFFFSSDRMGGVGGLDIYASRLKRGGLFTQPVLLEDTINSAYDDFGLCIADNGNYGFFTSNRAGNGDDDLYQIILDKQVKTLKGLAVDANIGSKLPGVKVSLFSEEGTHIKDVITGIDGEFEFSINRGSDYKLTGTKEHFAEATREVHYRMDSVVLKMEGLYQLDLTVLDAETMRPLSSFNVRNAQDGHIWEANNLIKLVPNADNSLRIESEGFLFQRIAVNTRGLSYGILKDTVLLYPFVVDKVFELENIYYDFNKWNLTEPSKRELDKLVSIMKENSGIKVHLRSHTDSRGADQYNLQLSKKRSQSCEQYLVHCGIAPDRIIPHGYGETQLLNECGNGVECPEEMHQANRRTEIQFEKYLRRLEEQERNRKIIRESGNRFFIIGGSFRARNSALAYLRDVKSKGFDNALNLGVDKNGVIKIALEGFSDLNLANKRLSELKKDGQYSELWLYDYGR